MSKNFLFTSESVTEGHPDKLCDQISDSVLDAYLALDSDARVACEVMVSTGLVIVAGEISSHAKVDITKVVREKIKKIGYDSPEKGLDYQSCAVISTINQQSADIAQGVNVGQGLHKIQGAGDQGLMFGYATDETEHYMPMPIHCANLITQYLAKKRRDGSLPYLRPDGKAQVTVCYEGNQPKKIDTVVVSTQHAPEISLEQIIVDMKALVHEVLPANMLDEKTIFHINPTGRFVIGGPQGDCGLTGRKIIVDTYGGMGRHGGGAFSGKDPSKVDRSAAYVSRYLAKNIVAAGLAKECEIQLAYAIGYDKPVSVNVNTFGTALFDEAAFGKKIATAFPLTPSWMIEHLQLRRPIYQLTAAYGHFGRPLAEFSWEKLDLIEELKHLAVAL